MRKITSSNFLNEQSITINCPIMATLKMVGGRWKLHLLWSMKDKPMRYKELHRAVPDISEKMLTQQLGALVREGWVIKKDYKEIPPRTEYSLSELGASFVPILQQIYDWGVAHNSVALANAVYANEDMIAT